MTAKILLLSQLSASRQAIVRLCQDINFGQIRSIHILDAEPIFDPAPVVVMDIRLDLDEITRTEAGLPDFELSEEVCRLLVRLDEIQNGIIDSIDVRAGVPRRIVFQRQVRKATL